MSTHRVPELGLSPCRHLLRSNDSNRRNEYLVQRCRREEISVIRRERKTECSRTLVRNPLTSSTMQAWQS